MWSEIIFSRRRIDFSYYRTRFYSSDPIKSRDKASVAIIIIIPRAPECFAPSHPQDAVPHGGFQIGYFNSCMQRKQLRVRDFPWAYWDVSVPKEKWWYLLLLCSCARSSELKTTDLLRYGWRVLLYSLSRCMIWPMVRPLRGRSVWRPSNLLFVCCFFFVCLFVCFRFFAILLMSRSLSHRIKAVLPSNQQDFWNCHNGYNCNRQE